MGAPLLAEVARGGDFKVSCASHSSPIPEASRKSFHASRYSSYFPSLVQSEIDFNPRINFAGMMYQASSAITYGIRNPAAPYDHVVIFDEAQRAWNREKTADFMKRRKKLPNFSQSESEFLISYLDRHKDWAVIICLVGGGQEIHTGEAGIGAWLDALRESFRNWVVYVSPDLTDSEYAAGHALDAFAGDSRVIRDARLHLSTSMRAFRSERVSAFVKALLDCDRNRAGELLRQVSSKYPIALTTFRCKNELPDRNPANL